MSFRHLAYFLAIFTALIPAAVYGQSSPSGRFIAGHALRANGQSGTPYSDAGGAGGSTNAGAGFLSEIGIKNTGTPFCIYDDLTNAPGGYHQFCLGANSLGGGLIAYNAFGGATQLPLSVNLNGTLYQFPFNINGVLGPGSSIVGNAVTWNNGVGTLVKDAGAPPQLRVSTNTALKALAGSVGMHVIRAGFAAADDTIQVIYAYSASACALGAGAGDNGLQVVEAGGGCWNAQLDGNGADIRLWGVIGSADDTALAQKADTAMASASWPSGVAKTLLIPGATVNLKNWLPTAVQRISGAGRDISTINLAASATTSDVLVRYEGAGPFQVDNLTFQCPLSNPATRSTPAGTDGLRIGAASTVQSSQINIFHVKTIGCQNGITIYGAQYVYIDDLFNDRPFNFGWIVSDAKDTAAIHTRQARIHNTYGVNAGQYCGSAPANGGGTTIAATKFEFLDIGCDGAGFKDSKFCFDLPTGSSVQDVLVRGWGRNCFAGGLEAKVTNSAETPPGNRRVNIDFTYYANYDGGAGQQLAFEGTGTDGDYQDVSLRGNTVYTVANARAASTYYEAGAVWQANGNTYKVVTPGTTDGTSGPSGTTGFGITDGSAIVDYLQATPAQPTAITCVIIEALQRLRADVTCNSAAYGVITQNRGRSSGGMDLNLVAVNLRRSCFSDSFGLSGANASLRITGSCSSASDNGEALFNVGQGASDDYTALEIVGGSWRQVVSSTTAVACIRRNSASTTFNLSISGAAHFQCQRRVMYLEGPSAITVSGGFWEILDATNGAQAVTASGVGATGTVEVAAVRLKSSVSVAGATYDAWVNSSSATMNIYGRFIRGFKAATPTDHCNSGDTYLAQAPGVAQPANGWFCSAPGTGWSAS